MTDNRDEILIKKFFNENMPEIEDRGFSERVMSSLPRRTAFMNRFWGAVCTTAGIIIFILCHGWKYLTACFYDITAWIYTFEIHQTHPVTLAFGALIITTLAINNYALSND